MSTWIRGQPVDFDAAVREAAALLDSARAPVIAGLAADVDAIRAAFSLGRVIGASFDPAGAANLYGELAVFTASPTMTTAPSEMLQRADVVVAVGTRAARSSIVDMARSSQPAIGHGEPRQVLTIGDTNTEESITASLALLRALVAGRLALDHPLAELARTLSSAQFGVAVYDPGELSELGVEMLLGMVVELNEKTRFFALSQSDEWQGRCALQVSTWTTASPPRLGLGRSRPEHDPWRFDSNRQASAGELDAALWLSSVESPTPPWIADLPSVSLVGEPDAATGDVVFAVGVPGRDHGGVLWNQRIGTLSYVEAREDPARRRASAVVRAIEDAIVANRGQ